MMGAVVSAGMMAGCPPMPPQPRPGAVAQAAKVPADAPTLGDGPVAKGVFIAIDTRTPLAGEALARAKLTREQVFALVKGKAIPPATTAATAPATSLPATTPAAVADSRTAEPPPQAVKDYLRGRQLFLDGSNTNAMAVLEDALKLDPQSFTVLRLMGRVCFAAQQLARGAIYLQRAQGLHPQDVEVNYLLGRYWLERNDNDRAAYYLMCAEDSPERLMTSTQTPLSSFYLGIALQQGGYHVAAAREYEHFLEVSELPIAGYRYDGELNYLLNMQWATHLAAAENDARVGDFHAALPHYRAAAAARPDDPFIASRLVNALAHDGQTQAAQQAAMALLAASHGGEDSLRLLAWTYQSAGQEKRLVADLSNFLQGADSEKIAASESQKTILLAAAQDFMGDRAGSIETYHRRLSVHPADMEVLTRLLQDVESPEAFGRAMSAAAAAIAADRSKTDDVLRQFVPVAEGAPGAAWESRPVTVRLDQQSAASKSSAEAARLAAQFAALDYLEAITRLAHNAPTPKIEEAFEASLKWSPDFFQPREAYIDFLLNQEKFSRAAALIDVAVKGNPGSAKAWELEIESEAAQQRYVSAQQLATEAKAKFPADVDIRMKLVAILRLRGMDSAADAELQSIITDNPAYETAYRQLINSLFLRLQRGDPNANLNVIVATLNKLAAAAPDSHYGRVMGALVYARAGRNDDAENVLKSVLAADPDEADALVLLAQLQERAGRPEQGVTLLEGALKRKPQLEIVRALAAIQRDTDHKPEALALVRQYMEANPDAESYALLCVNELIAQEKRGEAASLAADSLKKFPRSQAFAVMLARLQDDADDHQAAIQTMRNFMKVAGETTDRLYLLSHFYSTAGNDDAAVAALQQVLTIMPDHIGANNDLGYFWVDAGIHLDQAEPMIRKALENKPDDPAFLDSLGWLCYKQGKFAEARMQLERAIGLPGGGAAEVVQHLGDTLYRLGMTPEAIERAGPRRGSFWGRRTSSRRRIARNANIWMTRWPRPGRDNNRCYRRWPTRRPPRLRGRRRRLQRCRGEKKAVF